VLEGSADGRPQEHDVIRRQKTGDQIRLTFALPHDAHAGAVSVVGDFNDWTPGAHTLVKRSNGTRSVAVAVPAGSRHRFRYLGEGGHWFDDAEADGYDQLGGLVHA
jgi:1,4-alpha-glucan branching enzyme